ncbi:Signal recognition particle receptor FtsY [Geodia barretti]|uniref:Signal recognition particle receptor FtsY n=1 Tax=Geodia barretti TaxID=519541 RepID=A0AA35RBN0_GEOBA|nr:Signal recognition particle receptor FtsY [Geodia barretti]
MLKFFLRRSTTENKAKTEQAVRRSRQTFFGQMTGLFRRQNIDDALWDELEELLISADVGVATTFKLIERLRDQIRDRRVSDPQDALALLKEEMLYLVDFKDTNQALEVDEKPLVILMVGINGVGKTTSIAKLTKLYQEEGKSVLIGAADTFRAAAIDQIQGADPSAVAFDTLQAARARNVDVVIIDTAGRLHTKFNLMEELKKMQRVLSRQGVDSQRVLLTIDATTGQNGLFQARAFTEAVDCEGVLLAKVDSSSKGGVVFAIADELDLPVLFIGTGEQPDDLAPFDPESFVESLFADPDQ